MFLLLNCILVTVSRDVQLCYLHLDDISYMQLHKDGKTASGTVHIVLFKQGHSSSLRVMSMVFFCCLQMNMSLH